MEIASKLRNLNFAMEELHIITTESVVKKLSVWSQMIEDLMCRFSLDIGALSERFGTKPDALWAMVARMRDRFGDQISIKGDRLMLKQNARLIARLCAQEIDAYAMPEGRHSRAM